MKGFSTCYFPSATVADGATAEAVREEVSVCVTAESDALNPE